MIRLAATFALTIYEFGDSLVNQGIILNSGTTFWVGLGYICLSLVIMIACWRFLHKK